MRLYRYLLLVTLSLICLAWLSRTPFAGRTITIHEPGKTVSSARRPSVLSTNSLREKAADARQFTSEKGYNETICFLIDMRLPSGQNRFFVYNLQRDTIIKAGLVTHGRCNQDWLEGRKYGNTVGCGCTSLGKYKIGYSYNGRFGLAYKLYGLDKTNDNAFSRFVVLHSHECVPDAAINDDICQSDGCPTVSPGFLQYLKPILDASKKPVLLWIYQ